ncbi:MAG: DHHA1 domain-containing protein [Vulcanimicrobiota bacterium]
MQISSQLPAVPLKTSPKGLGPAQADSQAAPLAADSVQISGAAPAETARTHGGGCPCCMEKAALKSAVSAARAVPGGGAAAYLETTPELRARIDALPVKPQDITHVLYHADCFDGFGARLAAEQALGDKAQYIPVSYKDGPPQLPADARVAIVDFSYPRQQLLEFKDKVAGLVVLDHHEKARQQLEGLPFVVFEQERAGAGLSWAYFHPDQPEPELLKYVEDRDLWKFKLDSSEEVSSALGSYPKETGVWQNLDIESLKKEGATIERYKAQLVNGAAERAVMGSVAGYKVPITSCAPELRSEVGHALREKFPETPFAAVNYVENGRKMWSLRSEDGGFDVNAVANKFGGGGHKAAAGFRDPGGPEPTEINPPQA